MCQTAQYIHGRCGHPASAPFVHEVCEEACHVTGPFARDAAAATRRPYAKLSASSTVGHIYLESLCEECQSRRRRATAYDPYSTKHTLVFEDQELLVSEIGWHVPHESMPDIGFNEVRWRPTSLDHVTSLIDRSIASPPQSPKTVNSPTSFDMTEIRDQWKSWSFDKSDSACPKPLKLTTNHQVLTATVERTLRPQAEQQDRALQTIESAIEPDPIQTVTSSLESDSTNPSLIEPTSTEPSSTEQSPTESNPTQSELERSILAQLIVDSPIMSPSELTPPESSPTQSELERSILAQLRIDSAAFVFASISTAPESPTTNDSISSSPETPVPSVPSGPPLPLVVHHTHEHIADDEHWRTILRDWAVAALDGPVFSQSSPLRPSRHQSASTATTAQSLNPRRESGTDARTSSQNHEQPQTQQAQSHTSTTTPGSVSHCDHCTLESTKLILALSLSLLIFNMTWW